MLRIRKNKKNVFSLVIASLLFISILSMNFKMISTNTKSTVMNELDDNNKNSLKYSDYWEISNIYITHDNWSETLLSWIQVNNGTESDPHVIENATINAIGSGITIEDSNDFFTIRNCTIIGSGINDDDAGILLKNTTNGLISNNNFTQNEAPCVSLIESRDIEIIENNFTDNDYHGIYLYNSNSTMIKNNTILGPSLGGGIFINNSSNNNEISGNIIAAYYYGITIRYDSISNIIDNNEIYGCPSGINLLQTNLTYIYNNYINSSGGGIDIWRSNHNNITDNQIDYAYQAIWMIGEPDTYIINNTVYNNKITNAKVDFNFIKDSVISNNTIINSTYDGFLLTNSINNELSGNILTNIEKKAINIYNSNNTKIFNNLINTSNSGIMLKNTFNNHINSTTIKDCNIGIILEDTNYSNITYNLLTYNNYSIIKQGDCNNNLFENNTRYTTIKDAGAHLINIIPYEMIDYQIGISLLLNDYTEILTESLNYNPTDIPLSQSLLFLEVDVNDTLNLIGNINITIESSAGLEHTKGWWFNETANGGLGVWEEITISIEDGKILFSIEHNSIFGITIDLTEPTWIIEPVNQIVEIHTSFTYDVDASDNFGIDHFWINDTTNFIINNDGTITNNTVLEIGDYWLLIRTYDYYDNYCEALIKISVVEDSDSTPGIPGYNFIILVTSIFSMIFVILLTKKTKF